MDAIVDRLRARDELEGVPIEGGPSAERGVEGIELWNADDEQETRTTGRRKMSSVSIQGQCWAIRAGSGEATVRAARDRAFALAAQIEKMLRESTQGMQINSEAGAATCREAHITTLRLRQGVAPSEQIATLDFVIVAKVELSLT
jgi:hypothetical protein